MMRRAAIGLALLTTLTLTAQQRIELREGILVHPAEDVAYTMTLERGVAAVNLLTGTTKWTTKTAAKPVLLVGSRLLCQIQPATVAERDDLLLAALDVAQGTLVTRGGIDLPDEVNTAVTETPFGHFFIAAKRLDDDSADVRWDFVPSPKRAMREDGEEGDRPLGLPSALKTLAEKLRDIVGGLRINLATGTIADASDSEEAIPRPDDWLVPGTDRDDKPGTQYHSADGRAILTSERVADDREWNNQRWVITDTTSGAKLGEIRTHVAFAPFVVRQGILVIATAPYIRGDDLQPAKLRGYDLATGSEKWNFPVRETVFRGPTPP